MFFNEISMKYTIVRVMYPTKDISYCNDYIAMPRVQELVDHNIIIIQNSPVCGLIINSLRFNPKFDLGTLIIIIIIII